MSESWIESELKAALEESYIPAPWLLSRSMTAVRRSRSKRPGWAWATGVAAVLLAVSSIAVFESIRQTQTTNRVHNAPVNTSLLPQPIRQPITRTSPGAQVAWLWVQKQGEQPSLVAIDPTGRVVVRLDPSANPYFVWRSADGATIYAAGLAQIVAYSALDGRVQRTYGRNAGTIVGNAFSPDGRWLAVLEANNGLQLQLIDLTTGASELLQIPHDSNLQGTNCSSVPNCAKTLDWGFVLFAPNSARIYTFTEGGGPARLSVFSVAGAKLLQTSTDTDSQQGREFSSCSAPAAAAKIVAGGRTLVVFCHMDGAVWFFDLTNLTTSEVILTEQRNPFWLSPIFTPDGQLLYLHQWPAFGDAMQVIDLSNRRILGPVATPTKASENGPFAWLVTDAYAGGVASTVPVSPDGLNLYSATDDGVMVLRIPDLKPLAKLAVGYKADEVWISGDGHTLYFSSQDGKTLMVMHSDGTNQRLVNLPNLAGGFISSEHG